MSSDKGGRMTEEKINSISTERLFSCINVKRREAAEPVLENALLASKLGILIAVKTDRYANFRHEIVSLTEPQLNVLSPILEEFFNVRVSFEETSALLVDYDQIASNHTEDGKTVFEQALLADSQAKRTRKTGVFSRIKSFFSRKK
jgi:hypothetical protein